jgi:hypothetical protein
MNHDFTNARGEFVRELHAHRLVVNHVIEANTPEKLQFAQFNNDGVAHGMISVDLLLTFQDWAKALEDVRNARCGRHRSGLLMDSANSSSVPRGSKGIPHLRTSGW